MFTLLNVLLLVNEVYALHVVGVKELVLGAPWVVGGGGIVGGVSLDCVFTSTGESGIVECFSIRSVIDKKFM